MHFRRQRGDLRDWVDLAKRSRFKVREMARIRDTSVRQMERDLKRDIGRNPKEWVVEQRMVAARFLLLEGLAEGGFVKEVSFELGFKQPSHFTREFKRVYGMTPVQYFAKETTRPAMSRLDK